MQPTNSKVVWGYSKLLPHLVRVVYTSRFIETTDKDGLIRTMKDVLARLIDMEKRERGVIPFPPSTVAKINKERKRKH